MPLQDHILTFAYYSFEVRNRAHIFHFITKNDAQHKTLGDFYEQLIEVVDSVCEVAISEGVNFASPFQLSGVPATPDAPTLVRRYSEYIITLKEELQKLLGGHLDGLLSLLDDLIVLCNRTLFRLTMT